MFRFERILRIQWRIRWWIQWRRYIQHSPSQIGCERVIVGVVILWLGEQWRIYQGERFKRKIWWISVVVKVHAAPTANGSSGFGRRAVVVCFSCPYMDYGVWTIVVLQF
ncbi:hypothetical protein AALP_AA7G208800 [Arabis alpina]|uniref:Uncharacterized protein n=1 Tax=Arabis alpina TaxID=50452 RepID=A0A087GJI0_ARAAL|nr:hypothetical protein AALP_AA7G208800 [Arabis alpina]